MRKSLAIILCTALVILQFVSFLSPALADSGSSSSSPSSPSSPSSRGIPGYPANWTVKAGTAHVLLSWDAPPEEASNVTGYKIYRGTTNADLPLYKSTPLAGYNDTDVVNGTTYYYSVSAVTADGEGLMTTTVSAMPVGTPVQPTYLKILEVGDKMIKMEWGFTFGMDGGSEIIGYNVYKGTSPNDIKFFYTSDLGFIYTIWYDYELENGVTYYYKASAYNAIGEGPLSEMASATPIEAITEPLNVTLTAGCDRMVLKWDPPLQDGDGPITGYGVYRGTTQTNIARYANVTTGTSYTDTNVTKEQFYYYRVTAFNSKGEGSVFETDVKNAQLNTTGCDKPKDCDGCNGPGIPGFGAPLSVGVLVIAAALGLAFGKRRRT